MFVSQGLSFSNTHLLAQGQAVRSAPIQDLAPFCLSVTPRPSPPQASTQARCSPAGLSGQTPGRAAPKPDLSTATALRIQLRGRGEPVLFSLCDSLLLVGTRGCKSLRKGDPHGAGLSAAWK